MNKVNTQLSNTNGVSLQKKKLRNSVICVNFPPHNLILSHRKYAAELVSKFKLLRTSTRAVWKRLHESFPIFDQVSLWTNVTQYASCLCVVVEFESNVNACQLNFSGDLFHVSNLLPV